MSTTVARPAPTQGATKKALAMILGIPVVIGLLLWAFLAPAFASGPDGVPVAVAGPGPVVEKLIAQAEQQEEHPDFITVSSPEEAETMAVS